MSSRKLKVGFYGISGCSGCLLTVLYEDCFKEITRLFDIKAFPFVKEDSYKGRFDYVFIEGTVCSDKDIIMLNKLRERADKVVALGSCACFGGVPSIKGFHDRKKVMGFVYPKYNHLKSELPTPIKEHIEVDYSLSQCPPDKKELVSFMRSMATGRKFRPCINPVCFECRKKGNPCLLDAGKICLGPVTNGGCGAICPTNGATCYGCRGPSDDANYDAFFEMLKKMGYKNKEIRDKLEMFAGLDFENRIGGSSKWLEK